MKTVFIHLFLFHTLVLSGQLCDCCEVAFQKYTKDTPLDASLVECLLTEVNKPFAPKDQNERYSRVKGLLALGDNYIAQKDFFTAERTASRALSYLNADNPDDWIYLAHTHNLLGIFYEFLYQYDLAEANAVRSKDYYAQSGNQLGVYNQLGNLASLYSKMGKYDDGVRSAREAIAGFEKARKENQLLWFSTEPAILAAHSNMALNYEEEGKKLKFEFKAPPSKEAFEAALLQIRTILPEVAFYARPHLDVVYYNVINIFYQMDTTRATADSVIYYSDQLLNLYKQSAPGLFAGWALAVKGGALARKGQLESGLSLSEEGLRQSGYVLANTYDCPKATVGNDLLNSQLLIAMLVIRADIMHLLYARDEQQKDKGSQLNHLKTAVALISRATELIQQLSNNQLTDESTLIFRTLMTPVFGRAAIFSADLYNHTKTTADFGRSFDFSEQTRAFVLRNQVRQVKLDGIEEQCRKQEMEYKSLIRQYRAQNKPDSVVKYTSLLKDSVESWRTGKNPEALHYYKNRFDNNTVSVETIRKQLLDDTTALISYSWDFPRPVVYAITRTHLDIQFVEVDETFLRQANKLVESNLVRNEGDPFYEQALFVYDALLGRVMQHSSMKNIKRLVIVADGLIRELPFELLLPEKPRNVNQPAQYPYLLHRYVTGYEYSATTWYLAAELSKDRIEPGKPDSIGIFISEYGPGGARLDNCNYNPLKAMTEFAQGPLASRFGGRCGIFRPARAEHFENAYLGKFDVLQLVMHTCDRGEAGSPDYMLLLSNDTPNGVSHQISSRELYTKRLKAKMAVMGSCDTQNGQNQPGEGTIGLARALYYAGCYHLIATLHEVDDRSTSQIFRTFYDYLGKGLPSDAALTQAKRDYLKEPLADRDRPYYWANIVSIGPPQYVQFGTK